MQIQIQIQRTHQSHLTLVSSSHRINNFLSAASISTFTIHNLVYSLLNSINPFTSHRSFTPSLSLLSLYFVSYPDCHSTSTKLLPPHRRKRQHTTTKKCK